MQQYGKMKRGVKQLGTSLELHKGQIVELRPVRNQPNGGYFAHPASGQWSDEREHSRDDSILTMGEDFAPIFGNGKPTRRELVAALSILLQWATGGDKGNNPYSYAAVETGLQTIARARGLSADSWLDLNLLED